MCSGLSTITPQMWAQAQRWFDNDENDLIDEIEDTIEDVRESIEVVKDINRLAGLEEPEEDKRLRSREVLQR